MATPTSPSAAAAGTTVSKTKLLRDLYSDVQQIKQSIEPAVQVSAWVKDQFKPSMKKMKGAVIVLRFFAHRILIGAKFILSDMIDAEIQSMRTDLATTDAYAKNITQWIKDTLGTKLEKVTEMLQETVQTQLERQALEAKQREESLWNIFTAKFDNYMQQVRLWRRNFLVSSPLRVSSQAEQERLKYDAQVQLMSEEMRKIHSLRIQMEQAHAGMKQTHELVLKESRERPEQEMQMFRKLTKKLEDERKKIEDARQQMEEERRKMEEERSKFDKMLEEERKRLQDRQILEYERKKLEDERQLLLVAHSRLQPAATPAPPAAPIATNTLQPFQTVAPVPSVPVSPDLLAWLSAEDLAVFAPLFVQFGYQSLPVLALLDEDDLDIMNITLPGHRKSLLAAAARLRSAASLSPSSTSTSAIHQQIASEPEAVVVSEASSQPPKPVGRKLPLPGTRPLPKAPPQ